MLLLVLGTGPLLAGEAGPGETQYLTLDESMARARRRPAGQAWQARAEAADQVAVAERRAALLPVVGASVSLSDRDRDLILATPIGELPFGESRQRSAGVEVVQPLLVPSRLLWSAPASRSEAEAVHAQADHGLRQLAASAAAAHLDVLALDARIDATRAHVGNLGARLAEVEEMVAAGRALPADALKLRLALEQAEQDLLSLRLHRAPALAALALAVGSSGPVEPLPVPELGRAVPDEAEAIAAALACRHDLAALRAALTALEQRRGAVRAELLPRLDARATWSWSDGSPYTEDSWIEGAVTLTWTPFAAGTRGPRAAALGAEQRARQAELEELRRSIEIEVRTAIADLTAARAAGQVAEQGVAYAAETLRVERERHLAGRATTNDLLEAEVRLHERRTTRDLARLEVVSARVRLWFATGSSQAFSGGAPSSAESL
jgi:outer membrane protein TolC